MKNMTYNLVLAAALFGLTLTLAPNAMAENDRNTIKIQDCLKTSAAPTFLTCNDLDMLDIR